MQTGEDIYKLAITKLGLPYRLGVLVPKNDPDYNLEYDCAELTTWLTYQISQKLYGCVNNLGNPVTADAYTGFYKRDADTIGKIIPVDLAAKTLGAFLLRYSGSGVTGHVVISNGKGGTVEAHSTKRGLIKSVVRGRRWDIGVLIPWINYDYNTAPVVVAPPASVIYRWTTPLMRGDMVRKIQEVLNIRVDGVFGSKTFYAVKSFQNRQGLVPDGEAGSLTLKELGII